jgi:hypothetical protein
LHHWHATCCTQLAHQPASSLKSNLCPLLPNQRSHVFWSALLAGDHQGRRFRASDMSTDSLPGRTKYWYLALGECDFPCSHRSTVLTHAGQYSSSWRDCSLVNELGSALRATRLLCRHRVRSRCISTTSCSLRCARRICWNARGCDIVNVYGTLPYALLAV